MNYTCWWEEQGCIRHNIFHIDRPLVHLPPLVLEHVQEDLLALVEVPQDKGALLPRPLQLGKVLVQHDALLLLQGFRITHRHETKTTFVTIILREMMRISRVTRRTLLPYWHPAVANLRSK